MAFAVCGSASGGSTALISGSTREAPRYGMVFSAEASRKWYTAYQDHYEYIKEGSHSGVLRHKSLIPVQLTPLHIRRVLARSREADGISLDNDKASRAV